MNPPGQAIIDALHTITLLIYIHIYTREIDPPGQLITEALHTTTLLIYIYVMVLPHLVGLHRYTRLGVGLAPLAIYPTLQFTTEGL